MILFVRRTVHLGLLLIFTSVAIGRESPQKRVLAIGIDGLRPDALKTAHTPNLDALIEHGAFSDTTQILGARYQKNNTVSGPGWSSFLTGVWADKHGVHDNSFDGRNYEQFPHFFTYVKRRYPNAKTASFVDWSPIDEYIVSDADIRKNYPSHGHEEYTKNDLVIAREACDLLAKENPHAAMVYSRAVDETGHRYGFHPSVKEYVSAIETVDQHVGTLISALHQRETFTDEDWLVLVSTDHGGLGLGHGDGHQVPEIRTTFLIVSGTSAKPGTIDEPTYIVDLPVTALTHLGVEIDPKWKLDGRAVGLKVAE